MNAKLNPLDLAYLGTARTRTTQLGDIFAGGLSGRYLSRRYVPIMVAVIRGWYAEIARAIAEDGKCGGGGGRNPANGFTESNRAAGV